MEYCDKLREWKEKAREFVDANQWANGVFVYQWKVTRFVDLSSQESIAIEEDARHEVRVAVTTGGKMTLSSRRAAASFALSMCSEDTDVASCLIKKPPTMSHRLA